MVCSLPLFFFKISLSFSRLHFVCVVLLSVPVRLSLCSVLRGICCRLTHLSFYFWTSMYVSFLGLLGLRKLKLTGRIPTFRNGRLLLVACKSHGRPVRFHTKKK